ncbi:anti-sigma regulatory factor (Ser/Thr protein kinase) [Phycicoccus badiiscoriae]|uniref:Anti-sigma regulatory factor (Ser/Thr protein kinase) n=1 Tax=Pedococcus badiiscoriae TaxID=642776 RepID=A0A852WAM2_9MICO|nr:anti-sigma regulatory factor (Ser/Thr protein kinase) [Pedococcus badiiscoriae]
MGEGGAREARRLAAHSDWAATPLGPRSQWPPQLEAAWEIVLECPLPVALLCGDEFTMLYNDAFRDLLGSKHPAAFGQSARKVVAEIWDDPNVGPLLERAYSEGEAFLDEGTELRLDRGRSSAEGTGLHDEPDDGTDVGYYLRSGSPVLAEDGSVLAVLHVIVETTSAIGRARAVARLAAQLAVAVTVDDVCKVVLRQAMVAFDGLSVSVCLPSAGPATWRMARRHRIERLSPDEERLPLIWSELGEDMAAIIAGAISRNEPYLSDNGEIVAVPFRVGGGRAALVIQREAAPVPQDVLAVLAPFRELVGDALGRAVVYDAERTTAELLQRTLLPPNLPQSDAISIAARYEPVSEGTVAGGDFYDSFFLPDGRLAVVIGDVVGRGVMAATVMGQVRAAARGAALTDSDSASVMSSLDRVVWDLDALWPASMPLGSPRARPGMAFGGELFVTMLYGTVDPETGDVMLASAGHPPPALLHGLTSRALGKARGELLTMPVGPPLGIDGVRPTHHLTIEVGDMLVGFTDGLLERRGEALDEGEARLLEVLSEMPPGSPRSVAQYVMDSMLQTSGQEDDCAVLAIGRSPVGHRRAAIVVPPMPESVRAARDWAREQLTDWSVGDGDQHTIVTGISELITNAVLHAGTESHLTMDLDTGIVAVTVADSGNRGEPLLTGADTMAVRGRGLSLVRAISDSFGAHRTSAGSTVWFEVAVELVGVQAAARGWAD